MSNDPQQVAESIAEFAAKLRAQFQPQEGDAGVRDPGPWWHDRRALLAEVGFDPRRYGDCRADVPLQDAPSERRLQEFFAHLPQYVAEGHWLYLLGAIGTRKTGSMARLALALEYHDFPLERGQMNPALVRYRFAPEVAGDFAALGTGQSTGAMHVMLGARVVMLDDVHRWLEVGGYVRESIMAGWDTFTELRDGHGVTVVSANLTKPGMEQVSQFRAGLDRARGRGEIIEIRGTSTRGQAL